MTMSHISRGDAADKMTAYPTECKQPKHCLIFVLATSIEIPLDDCLSRKQMLDAVAPSRLDRVIRLRGRTDGRIGCSKVESRGAAGIPSLKVQLIG